MTVVPLLQALGFDVIRIGEDWTENEVQATVADYFEMLRLEADGLAFNKSEHNELLRKQLRGRSKASVELKHQNISAVLAGMGLPLSKATNRAATANYYCGRLFKITCVDIRQMWARLSMGWRR